MRLTSYRRIALQTVLLAIFIVPTANSVAKETEDLPQGHTKFTSIVTKKGGALVVSTPNGATHQLDANMARRHGQKPFKSGDEVVVVLDENNYIVDMHLKGREGGREGRTTSTRDRKAHPCWYTQEGDQDPNRRG